MKSPSPRPTCLADNESDMVTYEHNDRVLDPSLHYFGCLKASQRDEFFTQLPRTSQRQIVQECRRIRRLRVFVEANPTSDAGAILKEFKHGAKDWYRHDRKLGVDEDEYSPQKDALHTSVEEDIMAGMTFFKNGQPHTIPGLDEKFPNQKISVQQLLADDPDINPLMQPCESGTLRYFHLPANNMVWVEVRPELLIVLRTLMMGNRKPSHVITMRKDPIPRIAFKTQRSNKDLNTRCCFDRSPG